MAIESINPTTGKLVKRFTELNAQEIRTILGHCEAAFQKWKETTFVHRRRLMRKAALVLRKNKKTYAMIMTEEMGKPITQAEAEVEKCAWVCDYFAQNAEKFLKEEIIGSDAKKSYVRFDPLGVILAVMPWNFPFWQVFRFAAPGLMAGNAGVLKHASNVPRSALAIEEVFRKAGFPKYVFRTLLISSNSTEQVIQDDRVKAVTLTGSEAAGRAVAYSAGQAIKKTVLELGGSDPFIVLKDAQLRICSAVAAQARSLNTGQSCIAAKRFIVVKDVLGDFEDMMTQNMESMVVGDPLNKNTQVGPMAREDLRATLHKQVQESVRKGAKILTGGKIPKGKGYYYPPTILTNVKKGMPAYDEETFGPVAAIIPVKNEQEAITVANDSRFGLGASIWTKHRKKGQELARQIEAGAVFINGLVKSDPRLPFGGVKKSGYGRELSHYGIKEFVNIKTVWIK